MRRLLLFALLLAGAARFSMPQEATARRLPRFEAGIDVTQLNVSVTQGRQFITGLSRDDFAVFEDGVRQQISLFIPENLPLSLVLMLDTSTSMTEKLATARDAAKRFVNTLREEDLAEVVQFNDRITTLQEYTSDHAALTGAIDRTEAGGPTALHNALYVALKDLARQKKSGELRRWAIVLLSDGDDTASLVSDEQVIELARQTEIHIYAVSLGSSRPGKSFTQAAYLLSTLANDTGGRVYFPNSLSELERVYERIAEELRTQFSLGYVSNNARRDGKWRRIVVRLPARDDVEVRHKIGYYASAR
ncbi:MAG: VWA domain-containing protein [Vicinamibacteria bacterium]|nr:VWA domain-containing protein [Vicinamibacteria bacterium]